MAKKRSRSKPELIERLRAHIASRERDRRTEILDTAAELFGASGFSASVSDIAEACGILPGSLYHHFESKEAIVVELVMRYQTELDGIAQQAFDELEVGQSKATEDRIVSLATGIAECAIRHRAAALQTFYDPPATASETLVQLAKRTPRTIDAAMLRILELGKTEGYIRTGIDLPHLADLICQSMLHTAVGSFGHASPQLMPRTKCLMLLQGVSLAAPANPVLDQSPAFTAAKQAIASWKVEADSDPGASVRAAARREFGRRGYEATTIRNIAAAAGVSAGSVYRFARSKDELLMSIMANYISHLTAGWDAGAQSESTATEKLDALLWLDINILDQFSDEFKIQLAWLRETPPPTVEQLGEFTNFPSHMKALIAQGERTGQFRAFAGPLGMRLNCLLELAWTSENLVRTVGTSNALSLVRDTVIRGAAK